MEIKSIKIDAFTIAFREINACGKGTVFFFHGNSGSHRTWNKQLCSNALKDYRLIAFDLPGHGASSDSPNPQHDYSPIRLGEVLARATELLASEKPFVLAGSSLGSNLIAETLYFGLKPKGILLFSSSVTGKDYGLDKIFNPLGSPIFFSDECDEDHIRTFFEQEIRSANREDINAHTEDFRQTRPPFRTALLQNAGIGQLSDELYLLEQSGVPVVLLFGQQDGLLQTGYLDAAPFQLWQNKVFKIPEAGHYCYNDQPEIINALIKEYLTEMVK